MSSLRLVFMGTPDFAVPALRALQKEGHEIVSVYCQPPKPAGRGQSVQKTPIHLTSETLGLIVHTPRTLRDESEQAKLAAMKPDAIIVAAYGLILPQAILDIPRFGCLNIHGSLLPRWRGAAPIHRAILAGDTQTGITIMQMEAGLDTGPMLLKDSMPLTQESTASSIHDALADMGAVLIIKALAKLIKGDLTPTPQPEEGVTYAAKLTRDEGQINWHNPAEYIERQIRAFNPWPGTFFDMGTEKLKVLSADYYPDLSGIAGTLLDQSFTVACGTGAVRLTLVQRAGKKPTDGESLLRGLRLETGHIFP